MIICEDELISCLNLKLLMGGGSDISFSLQYVDVKQILFYVERQFYFEGTMDFIKG